MHFREGSGRWSPLTGLWAPGRQAWLCLRGSGVREAWVPQELEVRRGGRSASAARSVRPSGAAQAWPGALFVRAKRWACQEWDSNPRLQGRLRPERSALDRSAILTAVPGSPPLAWLGADANRRALGLARARARARLAPGGRLCARATGRDGRAGRPDGEPGQQTPLARPPPAPPPRPASAATSAAAAEPRRGARPPPAHTRPRLPSRTSSSRHEARVGGERQRALGGGSAARLAPSGPHPTAPHPTPGCECWCSSRSQDGSRAGAALLGDGVGWFGVGAGPRTGTWRAPAAGRRSRAG